MKHSTGRRNVLRGSVRSTRCRRDGERTGPSGSGQFRSAAESVPTSAQFYSFTQSGLSTAELIYEMEAAGYDYFEPFTISDDSDVDAITDAIDETQYFTKPFS